MSRMMEEKYDEGKYNEDNDWMDALPGAGEDNSVVVRAALYFGKKNKNANLNFFTAFAKDHIDQVSEELAHRENDVADGTGYSMKLYNCHQDYMAYFEEQLEDFINTEGASIISFEKECRQMMDGKSLTLFDNEDYSWFLDAIFSSMDFERFCDSMADFDRKSKNRNSKSSRKK